MQSSEVEILEEIQALYAQLDDTRVYRKQVMDDINKGDGDMAELDEELASLEHLAYLFKQDINKLTEELEMINA